MNTFAGKTLKRHECFWNSFAGRSYYSSILFQRYRVFPVNNTIPLFEVSSFLRKPTAGRLEVLFVNCNPSGTDVAYYKTHNSAGNDFFYYDNSKNAYFENAESFYKELGQKDENYAMIDLFPIVLKEQAVLKDVYKQNPKLFVPLLHVFVKAIEELQPKVIVVTNAFVRDVLKKEMSKFEENKSGVYYEMKTCALESVVFCGGMISGSHQMDVESKKRLIRDVRTYLNFLS